jgi:hypothetical protein
MLRVGVLLLASVLGPSISEAALIEYDAVLDRVFTFLDHTSTRSFTVFTTREDPLDFTGSLVGGNQLRFTYSASPGSQFHILGAPKGSLKYGFSVGLGAGSVFLLDGRSSEVRSVTFQGATGVTPEPSQVELVFGADGAAGGFRASVTYPGDPFLFQKVSVEFDLPASMNLHLRNAPSYPMIVVTADFPTTVVNPGPFGRIIPTIDETAHS